MSRPGRHLEGARTRERVLEVAAKLIATQGYAATSIAQISKVSGANPASIYWLFKSKEALFAAVMEQAADALFEEVGGFPSDGDPWQAIAALAEVFERRPEFLRLLLVLSLERREGDPAVLAAARRVRARAADALATAYALALPITDPCQRQAICTELARFTLMLFDGAFIASQIESDTTNLKRAFELIAMGVRAVGERLLVEATTGTTPKGEPQ